MTLADLRTLLSLAHGPAVDRLAATTDPAFGVIPRAVAWHFLTRHIMMQGASGSWFLPDLMTHFDGRGERPLDLTDPGTVNAVKVALALALGADVGAFGMSCSWARLGSGYGWSIVSLSGYLTFHMFNKSSGYMLAPNIAREEDPIKALILACQHVIKGKS